MRKGTQTAGIIKYSSSFSLSA